MVPMMVDVLLKETQTDETPEELEGVVVEFVDNLTGKQTIYQMMQLCEEIEKRGGVPKQPLEYKDLYNSLLLPAVDERIAQAGDWRRLKPRICVCRCRLSSYSLCKNVV